MLQTSREDVEFRISELIEWIKIFISRGDDFKAGHWAFQIAHCGNALLDDELARDLVGNIYTGLKGTLEIMAVFKRDGALFCECRQVLPDGERFECPILRVDALADFGWTLAKRG